MTNKSTYPQEWIAQDSIQMQSELSRQMNNDCEIGTIGKYVVKMSLADLKEIASGELRAYSEELEHENSVLQYKLDKAVEALKFYANADVYEDYDKYESTAVQNDRGQKARETLKEIEK